MDLNESKGMKKMSVHILKLRTGSAKNARAESLNSTISLTHVVEKSRHS